MHPEVLGVRDLVAQHVILLVVAPDQDHAAAGALEPAEALAAACRGAAGGGGAGPALALLCGLAPLGGRLGRETGLGRRAENFGLDEFILNFMQGGEVLAFAVGGQLRHLGLDLLQILGVRLGRLQQGGHRVHRSPQLARAPVGVGLVAGECYFGGVVTTVVLRLALARRRQPTHEPSTHLYKPSACSTAPLSGSRGMLTASPVSQSSVSRDDAPASILGGCWCMVLGEALSLKRRSW